VRIRTPRSIKSVEEEEEEQEQDDDTDDDKKAELVTYAI
jgi:hypothetical protein